MGEVAASHEANVIAAAALYDKGASAATVAKTLGISRSTAWRLKHNALLDPSLIQHVSKTLANKAMLGANAAVDTFLDKAENGDLDKESPIALAKAASVLMQSAGAYAALSGAKDTLSQFVDDYGMQPAHTSSKFTVTRTQQVVVEAVKSNRPAVSPSEPIEITSVSESEQVT